MSKYDDIPLGHQITYAREKFDVLGQPKWKVPEVVVIEAAVSGDHYQDPARRRGTANARELARDRSELRPGCTLIRHARNVLHVRVRLRTR